MRVVVLVEVTELNGDDRGLLEARRDLHTASFDEEAPITTIIDWANELARDDSTLHVRLSLDGSTWGSREVAERSRGIAENDQRLATLLGQLREMVNDIEERQFQLFARNRYLSRLEAHVRDTLLGLLAPDYPTMVSEYSDLNKLFDDEVDRRARGESAQTKNP